MSNDLRVISNTRISEVGYAANYVKASSCSWDSSGSQAYRSAFARHKDYGSESEIVGARTLLAQAIACSGETVTER